MKHALGAALFSGVLCGCVPSTIEGPPETVALTSKGRSMEIAGYSILNIRAYENVGKNRVWIEERDAVPCTISSPYFRAKISAPGAVQVPTFPADRKPISVSCVYKDETVTQSMTCFHERGSDQNICSYADAAVTFGN